LLSVLVFVFVFGGSGHCFDDHPHFGFWLFELLLFAHLTLRWPGELSARPL
jgi:hypothetical protein